MRSAPATLWDRTYTARLCLDTYLGLTIGKWLHASPVRALLQNFSHPVFPGEEGGGKECRKPAGRAPES